WPSGLAPFASHADPALRARLELPHLRLVLWRRRVGDRAVVRRRVSAARHRAAAGHERGRAPALGGGGVDQHLRSEPAHPCAHLLALAGQSLFGCMMESKWKFHGVRVVKGSELDPNTAQTPGMNRAAAITKARAGAEKLWAGTVVIHPK